MKTLAVFLTLMAGIAAAFGQSIIHQAGYVTFQNTETGGGNHKIYDWTIGPLVGTQFVAELYYFDTTTSSLAPLTATISHFKASTTTQPGTWSGPAAAVALPGGYGGVDIFDDGTGEAGSGGPLDTGLYPVILAVRFWDITMFSTYEAAHGNGPVGDTGQFTYTQRFSVPSLPPDTQMLTQAATIAHFYPIPEPSAIALSVLGVAALLLCRRRK